MDLYFYLDIYADKTLIDYYLVSFKLIKLDLIETRELNSSIYITKVYNWEEFKNNVSNITLHEYGDELKRFSDVELAMREGYKLALRQANKIAAKKIFPATGPGCPPLEIINITFPGNFETLIAPDKTNIDAFLEKIIKGIDDLEINKR